MIPIPASLRSDFIHIPGTLIHIALESTIHIIGISTELVIRTSLEDARKATGIERTILHATGEGVSVFRRMGYRSVVKFPLYGDREREDK